MNLAENYAAVLKDGFDVKKVVWYMKQRGHLSLLPQVVKIIERSSDERSEVLVVAREEDAKGLRSRYPKAAIVVDPKIVGGFVHRAGFKVLDASHRSALVGIYRRAVHHG